MLGQGFIGGLVIEIVGHMHQKSAARLKDRFTDQGGAIEREVSAFLAELRQRKLIEE